MRTKKISLLERVLIRGFGGCIVGALILHPTSMATHDIIEFNTIEYMALTKLFTMEHIVMAGYFTVLGCIIGIIQALYIHKREQLYEEIKLISLTDGLTSIYNRRYFDMQFKKEIDRALRYSRFLTLLIIDLNDFKQYNDTFGHQQGDFLLKEIALLLNDNVRSPDFIARYGGDEFVIVMPETDKNNAIKFSERLHTEIGKYSSTRTGTQKGADISLSIGSATFPTDSKDIERLFNKADEQLYNAKGYKKVHRGA